MGGPPCPVLTQTTEGWGWEERGGEREGAGGEGQALCSPLEGTNPTGSGPRPLTSCNLGYHLQKQSHWRSAFELMYLGDAIQPLVGARATVPDISKSREALIK